MILKNTIQLVLFIFLHSVCLAQANEDEEAVRNKTKHLLSLLEKPTASEANIVKFGRYYYAAEDITFDGFHPADYTKEAEKEFVDSLCAKLRAITVDNDQLVLGSYKSISPTIHHLGLKYRKSMHQQFSILGLTFIKTKNGFLLMGVN